MTSLSDVASPLLDPAAVIVASFTSLMALDVEAESWTVIHEGRGKYFGMVAVDDGRLAAVSRPDGSTADDLLLFDRHTAELIESVKLPSVDTHQIRRRGQRLFVTDTGRGRLLRVPMDVLGVSDSETTVARFMVEDHLNSVHVDDKHISALLHQFGPSELVRLDAATGQEVSRIRSVGRNSHDLEPWRDSLLVCGSADGTLLRVHPDGTVEPIWQRPDTFTKGLAISGDLAFVGCSPPSGRRERWTLPVELAMIDLVTGTMVASIAVPQPGLVNALATIGRLDIDRRDHATPEDHR